MHVDVLHQFFGCWQAPILLFQGALQIALKMVAVHESNLQILQAKKPTKVGF
jgi:hypothetical protein